MSAFPYSPSSEAFKPEGGERCGSQDTCLRRTKKNGLVSYLQTPQNEGDIGAHLNFLLIPKFIKNCPWYKKFLLILHLPIICYTPWYAAYIIPQRGLMESTSLSHSLSAHFLNPLLQSLCSSLHFMTWSIILLKQSIRSAWCHRRVKHNRRCSLQLLPFSKY